MSEWKTVSIRQELIKEIEKIIKTGQCRSISEFISEAIRLRLEELRRVEATSTEKHQEIWAIGDETVKTALNLEEEKAQSPQPTPFRENQSQNQIQTALAQRVTQAIQKWPMNSFQSVSMPDAALRFLIQAGKHDSF
jgi:Arc/MetJ-type ribon-helix-helix transcriptional regulator